MEKAKIDGNQLFVFIFLFELGTSLFIPLGIEAGRDAWLAILIGAVGGVFIFLIHFKLYTYYPELLPTSYYQKLIGKFAGGILGYLYIVYFAFITARVLRDFGELLLTSAYPETPLFIINSVMMIVVIYGVKKGIEVLARTGELYIFLLYMLAIFGFILIWMSQTLELNRLRPMLENGFFPVLKVAATETVFVPFGDLVILGYIFPYLNTKKGMRSISIIAILISGVNLALTMAINVASSGLHIVEDSPFPLLTTIQQISVADFLERLDIIFLVALFIGAFFKISLFFYVACTAAADLFKLKEHAVIVYPFGIIILVISVTIASNYPEHLRESLDTVPFFLNLPFQVAIPLFLLIIAYFKNRRRMKKNGFSPDSKDEQNSAQQEHI